MNDMTSYLRRMWRAALTPESLLSLEEVAEALPGRPDDTTPWVHECVQIAGVVAGADVYRWGDVLRAVDVCRSDAVVQSKPITRWKEVAAILGVSEDTVARRRAEKDGKRPCFFLGAAEVQAWWRGLLEPVPVKPRRMSKPSPVSRSSDDGPVDWRETTRALVESRGSRS